ncbi:MAG TPA: plasmid pRiA4b ORF-3 family protein [Acidimicrobiales bacterium]|nr:plasmid pRiA4b ORF-3 family protein [Acidimicrobiales bacterium]
MRTTRLRVTMSEVEPTVVRVLDVPAGVLLPELHDLLQVAIGWTDSHLHQFVADGIRYGMPDIDGFNEFDDERAETGVSLRSLPRRFTYLYDFGDGWEHDVVVVGPGADRVGVVDGEGACPPEDVGGPHGYAEFLTVLANPTDPEHEHMRGWAAAWRDTFDLATVDLLVQQTVGQVPTPVQLVLSLVPGGVKLTPGGRLPRVFVRQVQEQFPKWGFDARPASIEEDLPPLAALHDLLRKVGLLRLRKGVLAPTRIAGDDMEVIRRLRSWFGPQYGYESLLTTDTLAFLAAEGPCKPQDMAGRLLELLGGRWVTSQGQRLDEARLRSDLYRLECVLVGLDLINTSSGSWEVGPSARWLLPRATALTYLWSKSADLV